MVTISDLASYILHLILGDINRLCPTSSADLAPPLSGGDLTCYIFLILSSDVSSSFEHEREKWKCVNNEGTHLTDNLLNRK